MFYHPPYCKMVCILAILALPVVGLAQTVVPLVNPGFEQPVLNSTPGGSWYSGAQGWAADVGIGTTYAVPWNDASPATEGNQYAWADLPSFNLVQIVGTLETNRRYVFSIDLFALTASPDNNLEVAIDVWSTTFSAYNRTTYSVYRPSWLPEEESFKLTPQRWQTVQVELNSAEYASLVGQSFRVRITGSNYAVDNARLIKYGPGESPVAAPVNYYLSAAGNDANAGTSPAAPWRSFAPLNARVLAPGTTVNLRRGDAWTEELNLRGEGTAANPITLTAYGDSAFPRPIIRRGELLHARAVVIQRPTYWRISQIDCRDSKVGLYLRYANIFNSRDVRISDCHFEGNADPGLDPVSNNYELSWSYGIFLGGHIWNDTMYDANVLDGLSITGCTFIRCAGGFGNGWYYPPASRQRLRNFHMADCWAVGSYTGVVALFNTDGGLVERCHSLGGGVNGWTGSALGFVQASQNVTIDNCAFTWCDRLESADGVGFDFEGDTTNCTFSNNIVSYNSGAGMLILSTGGPNLGLTVSGNTFFNNALNPWNSEMNSELLCGFSGNTGSVSNNGFYRRDASINFFSSNFNGFTFSGNRQLTYDSTREKRWWNFDLAADLEGWNSFNDWVNPAVTGGALTGDSSTGVDPFAHSPLTWIDPITSPYLWLRLRATGGNFAQLFYLTDADPVWNAGKMLTFPVTPDGVMRNYFVDLRSAGPKGIITQLRVDPPFTAGSQLQIDHVRSVAALTTNQVAPPTSPPLPQEMTFTSNGALDGWVLESGAASNAGGTINAGSTSLRLGDDAANARYRLVLSFDTSALPDNALITEVQLGINRSGVVGSDPWIYGTRHLSAADRCQADLAIPFFGASGALEAGDWQAAPTAAGVANFIIAYQNGLTVMDLLNTTGTTLVNVTGTTQFRVQMVPGTDNDGASDYITIPSGNAAASPPRLRVRYYTGSVPAGLTPPTIPPAWVSPLYTPTAPLLTNAQDTTLDITIDADGNPLDTEYAIFSTTLGQWLTALGGFSATPAWLPAQGPGGWNTLRITGLQQNTDYRFQVRARTPPWLETPDGPLAGKLTTPVELQSFQLD